MTRAFADSVYWIAISDARDQWHARAMSLGSSLRGVEIVTTEEVLTEFLAAFRYNAPLRRAAALTVERLQKARHIIVRHQSHQSFLDGLALYVARPDKQYSLTDCISMEVMRRGRITEALTHDAHFAQEGFTTLL